MINKKMKILSLTAMISCSVIGVGLGVGLSFVDKIQIPNSVKMENSKILSSFISDIGKEDFFTNSDFDKSIKLMNGETEITDYKDILIIDAYKNDYFKFEVPNKVAFFAKKQGIDVFLKTYNESDSSYSVFPSYYNSSVPEFNIWFGKGEGANRVEEKITLTGLNFYGFKKTQLEHDVLNVKALFKTSIKLKREFYTDDSQTKIKAGIFAKNIKKEDIVSDLTPDQLNNVNWSVASQKQDPIDPSKLIVHIDFNKGELDKDYFQQTYQSFTIEGFSIAFGVDDNVSKVKNFIAKSENQTGLGEAFKYTKPEKTNKVGTVLENYKAGAFALELPFSFKNRATTAGVEYIFKPWVSDEESDSVFPDEQDSSIPKFKIYIRSGSGTPLQYEEFFVIKGNGQVTNIPFDQTPNDIAMTEIREMSQGSNDIFKDKITLTLINEFAEFDSTRNMITAKIIADQPDAIDNLSLTLLPIVLDPAILPEGVNFKLNIKETTSDKNKLKVKVEIFIGTEFNDKASFIKTIYFPDFELENVFEEKLIKLFTDEIALDSSQEKVALISKPVTNKEAFINSIKKGDGYYFNSEVIVGYDNIMEKKEYKWTNKPSFKIDFTRTSIIGENINFKISIKTKITTSVIDVDRPINSFL